MTKTLGQRIEDVPGIDVYRTIVAAIPASTLTAGTQQVWGAAMDHLFPDPAVYATKIEGAPSKFSQTTQILGPRPGDNDTSMASLYEEGIRADLSRALIGLDQHWEGGAADRFTSVYMTELGKHLQELANACEGQKDAASKIRKRILEAHDDVVRIVEQMVRSVITKASLGTLTEAGGLAVAGAAGATTSASAAAIGAGTGLGAVLLAGVVLAAVLETLIDHHGQIGSVITALDTDLDSVLVKDVEGIKRENFELSVDRYTSKAGWQPSGSG